MLRYTPTIAALALVMGAPIAAQQNPDLTPYLIPDRAVEVALARSAAPANVSDSATVLVLTRTGFVEAAHGSNGFTCLVFRSFLGKLGDSDTWHPSLRGPSCFNPPASRTVLREILKRAEWVMGGVSQTEIVTRTDRAYATHDFPKPAPGAMANMLSHQQVLADEHPHWVPHLMFYYDKSLSAETWGAVGFKAPVIDGSVDDVHSPVILLLIPVRQWSDGTPALPGGN
jgi:hypothetical protein